MKTLLIIGASSDLGKAIAIKFASQNYNIVLASRNTNILKNISLNIESKFSVKCQYLYFDILVNKPEDLFNQLNDFPDLLISTIGLNQNNEFDISSFNDIFSINFTNLVILIEYYILKSLKKNLQISILIFSSIAGIRGRSFNYLYGASKSALIEYLSGLRQKYSKKIYIMTIIPGYIKTKSLPKEKINSFLAISCEKMANLLYKSYKKKKEILYSPYWFFISIILRLIPEKIFKRLRF